MGTGKTAIAREISRITGLPHIETDKVIEEKEECSISEIFAQKGEAYFRQLETDLLSALNTVDQRVVICTGGGMPVKMENRSLIKDLGYVVWLRTPLDETVKRVSANNDRPLLQVKDPKLKIKSLMDERYPIYREVSKIKVDTDGLCVSEIANGIIDSASYYFSEH